ncbi:UBN2_3 domain-containing protein [Cephalotus follicularis]|uniref:UBN2_3 domain-containing protein n=1 Tax=Cephalotus follicularis TaxID=3775 RepID=A0A1Q3AME9_CEPFO|nr:UBN2_3 domain-containing protein [Cephalotus follicularis]
MKLENFDGSDFNAWRHKMNFGMQLLKIYYTIEEEKPNFEEEAVKEKAYWDRDDDFCRSYLLNCLSNHLADVYGQNTIAKVVWDALEQQYKNEKKLPKTHLIDKFLDMRFEDGKEILPQVKELENLVLKLN